MMLVSWRWQRVLIAMYVNYSYIANLSVCAKECHHDKVQSCNPHNAHTKNCRPGISENPRGGWIGYASNLLRPFLGVNFDTSFKLALLPLSSKPFHIASVSNVPRSLVYSHPLFQSCVS